MRRINNLLLIAALVLITSCSGGRQRAFSFVQICDPQLGMGGYEHDVESLNQAVDQINNLDCDFVVICGDLVNHASDSSYADFLQIIGGFEKPCYLVPGNHDVGNIPNDTTLAYYRSKLGKDYYHFNHKGVSFIFTNSQLWKSNIGEESEKHDTWFKETIKELVKNGFPTIVIGHFPLYVESADEEEKYFNFPPGKRQELLDLFVKNDVKAYLSGHKHETLINSYNGIQLVSGETTSKNFDKRPMGFRQWKVSQDTITHEFVPLQALKSQSKAYFDFTKQKALDIIKTGFNAGGGYGEVWIRDYNTFIELSAEVFEPDVLKENLLVFFRMQGEDGNIIDGFIPKANTNLNYEYIYSDLEPRYAGHKNTVETDQETSLVQAVYKYVQATGDTSILTEVVGGLAVSERLDLALDFLMQQRYNEEYGLLWGATTADWGDVQPEHDWGVFITDDTHYALDIYDNAMFLIALDNLMDLLPAKKDKWQNTRNQIAQNTRQHLWDEKKQKFIPHIYLNGSPFPDDFNEAEIFYHGGTAVAIEANLLSREEVKISLDKMIENVEASGAASIGLTLFPTYPDGYFKNKSMYAFGYQNGGDWTWFGGRMIQQLIKYGYIDEAYQQLLPMVRRVKENDGFFEWYTLDNEPKGSGTFRGSAGVLYKAILMAEEYENKK